jgi:hypothetical protein
MGDTMPKIGDLVIFGEFDAPEAHCIGRITRKEGKVWYGEYLSERTRARYSGELCNSMVTPVTDFGVRVTVAGKSILVERVGVSIARYSDHCPRSWQEHLPTTIRMA